MKTMHESNASKLLRSRVTSVAMIQSRGYIWPACQLIARNRSSCDRDELRTSGASPIFERHRMSLGCSGLHANCYFTAEQK